MNSTSTNVKVYPSRLSLSNHDSSSVIYKIMARNIRKHLNKSLNISYIENFKKPNNPFIISNSSRRKIFDTINYIYTLSNKRHIKMSNNKTLYNFKASFITLTLPSKQNHTDTFIKKECLNQLLVELRKHYKLKNYIWKAELQKNQNIHFHLISDSYIDYQALRRRWNRILDKFDYVESYRNKMNNISLSEYHKQRNKYNKCTFSSSKLAYAKGKKTNWNNPNSVDVRSINNKKSMLSYMAKYISKNQKTDDLDSELLERQKSFGRAWSRSQSLSKIKGSLNYSLEEFKQVLNYFRDNKDKVIEICNNYCTVFYFDLSKLHSSIKNYLLNYIKHTADYYVYSSA